MVENKYKHTCSFTGHRPERLEMPTETVKKWLDEQIDNAIKNGYTEFISGMQRGVDIWAAETVLNRKQNNANIRLIAACAFEGMENRWESNWQERYKRILDKADEVYYIGEYPGRASFFKRDEWMVDHSTRLIGVFTGAHGGTEKTINYARKKGLDVFTIKNTLKSGW